MLPFVAAAVSYIWVYLTNSVSVIAPFHQPQMQSFSSANQMSCVQGSVSAVVLCRIAFVWVTCSEGGSMSSVRTAVHTAGVQLPSGEGGLSRTVLEGPGDGGQRFYLSPRMAYWLSSCKCCIEAPLFSSLPRFLCFTTSKVFSISLSLKHKRAQPQSRCNMTWIQTYWAEYCLNSTYLRVSTCLAEASREGNCASL